MQLQIDKLGKVSITVEEAYWDINKDYDKLTVVEKEGTFGTFISRKPVPAGTVLTDRKYWIPFSSLKEDIILDYNSFINKYGIELGNIKDHLDEINSKIIELTTITNSATSKVNDATVRIENIAKNIDNITSKANDTISAANTTYDEARKIIDLNNTLRSTLNQVTKRTKYLGLFNTLNDALTRAANKDICGNRDYFILLFDYSTTNYINNKGIIFQTLTNDICSQTIICERNWYRRDITGIESTINVFNLEHTFIHHISFERTSSNLQLVLKGYNNDIINRINIPIADEGNAGIITQYEFNKLSELPSKVVLDASINNLDSKIAGLNNRLDYIVNADTDNVINKFNEIVDFLANIENTNTLEGIINGINTSINEVKNMAINFHIVTNVSVSPSVIYKGEINNVNINYSAKLSDKILTCTATLDSENGNSVSNPYSVTDTRTFKLFIHINDETNNIKTTIPKSITVNAYYPKYYGYANKNIITETDILSFTKQPAASNVIANNITTNIPNTSYLWLCVPNSMTINKVTSAGFEVPMYSPINVEVTNKGTYKCYRSANKIQSGIITYNIQ